MKKVSLFLLLLTMNAFAIDKYGQLYSEDLPRKAVKISYSEPGKINELVKNSWIDRVKTDKGLAYYKYEQGYSYPKKQGFLKIYDGTGKLIQEKWDKIIDGAICQEEALTAIEIFKQNAQVKKQFDTTDETITLFTGFNFADETECKLGSRCVHVFAHAGKVSVLAHSIVRLTDASVPYPEYDMENTHKKAKLGLKSLTKQKQIIKLNKQ